MKLSKLKNTQRLWNIYIFHCSDGDNWPSDNDKTLRISKELASISQLYTYIQTSSPADMKFWSDGGILSQYNNINHPKFKTAYLSEKKDVWAEFKRIFGGHGELES